MSLAQAVDLRPEDLTGRRWAGYIRESTRGQADRYGPDLQRAEQERFAERYGLRPAGLEYLDLVSGKDTLRRSDFARMVADAEAGRFDVLLCYDTSRFARNVADAWSYRDRLARAGVVVVFCADTLISGNVDTYELEGLKTVSDAAYIRRLSRNVARGYEQKWRLFGDPGGHPPLGFARVGPRQLLSPLEGPDLDRVRRAFSLYAAGTWSDTTLADELGLTEAGLAEILTNPLYAGRAIRHKGRADEEERPTTFGAPVNPALFARVAQLRAATDPPRWREWLPPSPVPAGPAPPLRRLRQPLPRRCECRAAPRPPHPPSALRAVRELPTGAGGRAGCHAYGRRAPGRRRSCAGASGDAPRDDSAGGARPGSAAGCPSGTAAAPERWGDRARRLQPRLARTRSTDRTSRGDTRCGSAASCSGRPRRLRHALAGCRSAGCSPGGGRDGDLRAARRPGLRTRRRLPSAQRERVATRLRVSGEVGTGRGERASPSVTQQSLRFLMINRTPRESLPATARSA
jgi:DNA invertase Pin-like site-specific DNA recombinase